MRKVDELAWLDTRQQFGIGPHLEGDPTDVGDFFLALCKARARFRKLPEPRLLRRFGRSRVKPLHPNTDSEERNAARNR